MCDIYIHISTTEQERIKLLPIVVHQYHIISWRVTSLGVLALNAVAAVDI